jgi:hypothetical protein
MCKLVALLLYMYVIQALVCFLYLLDYRDQIIWGFSYIKMVAINGRSSVSVLNLIRETLDPLNFHRFTLILRYEKTLTYPSNLPDSLAYTPLRI